MADIQLQTHTQDIEITAPQTKDVVIGSPMDKGGVLPITKNGKYVVSDYDWAEVKVQPAVSDIKVTENGTYLPSDYDVDAFNKVEVQVDDTRRVMTEFVNNGGSLAYYNGTEMPDIDWDSVTRTNFDNLFRNAQNISLKGIDLSKVVSGKDMILHTAFIEDDVIVALPNATSFALSAVDAKKIHIYIPKVTSLLNFMYNCSVEEVELSAENLTSLTYSFYMCNSLKKIHPIECGHIKSFIRMFHDGLSNLEYMGGLIDFGKAIEARTNTPLYLRGAPKLTHQSLMNVLNGLYDIKEKGFSLILQLGETNYVKLTDDDIKIATDKGWTVTQ